MGKTPKWKLTKVKVTDIKDYHKNPRTLSKEQEYHLKTSVDKFGLIDKPIVNRDMTLIGGHQRKKIYEGKEIEVWVPDRQLQEKEVEELNIRLNANSGQFDFDILASEFVSTELIEWGLDVPESEQEIKSNQIDIQGYNQVHVLLSFHPDKFKQVSKIIEQIKRIDGIEYEQTAN